MSGQTAGTRTTTSPRRCHQRTCGRFRQLIAVSFHLLAPYIAAEAIWALIHADHPGTSISIGLVLTAGTAVLEPGSESPSGASAPG